MADFTGLAAQQFHDMLAAARTRVLSRYAGQAEESARLLREQKTLLPESADELEGLAVACDVYAAECQAAAADHTLPTPSGPNYPQRGDDRG